MIRWYRSATMDRRKFVSDINQLRVEGLCPVSLSDDAKFIQKVTMCVWQCQRFFHELEQDGNAVIVFQDEVHFMAESTGTCQWYSKGSGPKVKSHPGRKSVAYSGFVVRDRFPCWGEASGWKITALDPSDQRHSRSCSSKWRKWGTRRSARADRNWVIIINTSSALCMTVSLRRSIRRHLNRRIPLGREKRGKKCGKVISLIDRLKTLKGTVCFFTKNFLVPFDNN